MGAISAAVKHMLAAGMDHAAIVKAVEEMESAAPAKTARQLRNARYYEASKASEKRLSASYSDVSDAKRLNSDATASRPHVEDKTSNSEIEPLKKVKSAKRARFDADMPLPVEWHDWAIKRGLPPERVPVEFEKIRNWAANATGDKGLKSDWFRAWQNWVIGAIDNLPRNRAPPPRTNAALAAADALMEKFDAVSPSQTEADPPYPRLVALTGR